MGASNFVISVRNLKDGSFGTEPGPTRYLVVPDGKSPHPTDHKISQKRWLQALIKRAEVGRHPIEEKSPVSGYSFGDVLVFVHGYNNSISAVMKRHNLLQKRLQEQDFKGAIVSFDWPSATSTLNYLEDRSDARATALKLVQDGIALLARNQLVQDRYKCDIDVHLLGHSTGAYVIREAFYEASHNRSLSQINWMVSQVAFIGGDIAQKSTAADDGKSKALFQHSTRITNYQNPFDSALKVSNIKRLGKAPRIGRVGIADDAPDNIVNVNVGDHWSSLVADVSEASGNWSHSWHFNDPVFAKDLFLTLEGDIDRHKLPTRKIINGQLILSAG